MNRDEVVKKQLRLLQSIWRQRGGGTGYVFLSHIPLHKARAVDRKRSLRSSPAYKLGDWEPVKEYLAKHYEDELYFAPMVFNKPRRKREYATYCTRLWADLDAVEPATIPDDLTPNILWETSPGRYAAVWFMVTGRTETTERGGENHRLTLALGADPSGWDTTQLLRVPLSANNKPGYPEGIRGKLISVVRGGHLWEDIDSLPELADVEVRGGDVFEEELLDSVDAFKAYARIRRSLSSRVRQMMRLKVADDTFDRSAIAWEIERDLADAGATLLEMVAIMRPTPWNKFEGRDDELKRLTLECGKALSMKKAVPEEEPNLDIDTQIKEDLVPFWSDPAYLHAHDPEWLYKDLVPEGGCGFISGIPKSLKTYFGLDLAISAALGKSFLEYKIANPINVLYIQREDPTSEVKKRHHAIATSKDARYALDRPPSDLQAYPGALYIKTMLEIQLADEDWQVWLEEMIRRHDLKLVIFDTLVRAAPGVNLDKSEEVTSQVLNPLKKIARSYNCAMCFIHHNTKSQGNDRAGQNMAGSGQLHAWTDFLIAIKNKEEDPKNKTIKLKLDIETKHTMSRTDLVYLIDGLPGVWDPTPYVTEEKIKKHADGEREFILPDARPRKRRSTRTTHPNETLVRNYLRDRPRATAKEMVEALDLSPAVVGTWMKRIRAEN